MAGRDASGRMYADEVKFPGGWTNLSAYIQSKGLKAGLYSAASSVVCSGRVGSLYNEYLDAETFASWNIDYVKYDNVRSILCMLFHPLFNYPYPSSPPFPPPSAESTAWVTPGFTCLWMASTALGAPWWYPRSPLVCTPTPPRGSSPTCGAPQMTSMQTMGQFWTGLTPMTSGHPLQALDHGMTQTCWRWEMAVYREYRY